jgi:hypothetical protein
MTTKLKMTEKEQKIFNEDKINIKKPVIIKKSTKKKVIKEDITEISEKIEINVEDFNAIIIDISQSTHYKLNYFALKLKIMLPFILLYKKYENWFNKHFNSPDTHFLQLKNELPFDENEKLYENLLKEDLIFRSDK